MEPIQNVWKNLQKGDFVKINRDVYFRGDNNLTYEPPGRLIVHRDSVGTFSGKVEKGLLIYVRNMSTSGVLGVILDEFVVEKLNTSKK